MDATAQQQQRQLTDVIRGIAKDELLRVICQIQEQVANLESRVKAAEQTVSFVALSFKEATEMAERMYNKPCSRQNLHNWANKGLFETTGAGNNRRIILSSFIIFMKKKYGEPEQPAQQKK